MNFIDWENVDALLSKCEKINKIVRPSTVILCMGEPDTRYAMGLGWQPWSSFRSKDTNNYAFLEKCSHRYLTFVREISEKFGWTVYVQNIVLTQDPIQCGYIDFYNEKLAAELGDRFIAFNDELRASNGVIALDYSWDAIHANNRICKFVETHLKLDHHENDLISDDVMKKHFNKNLKFNGLEFVDKKRKPLLHRLFNVFARLTKGG